ncbi:MAG: beta-N-acetylhexosaminidase [Bacteroidales bacterium]
MKNNPFVACAFTMFMSMYASQLPATNIIPKPLHMQEQNGSFVLGKKISISADERFEESANLLASIIRQSTGFKCPVTSNDKQSAISLVFDSSFNSLGEEGYALEVTPQQIIIRASNAKGAFYGTQSLRQLLPAAIENTKRVKGVSWEIPCVKIKDKPRFGWRGYMKDVSRTFYGVDVIKKYLDVMALYKMNVFHWHLTDDQGWRIEIKKYPELTSDVATQFHESENQPAERSGFYTQEQIREVVDYAAARQITIVPEIDVPGHSWPTLLVYPELAVNKNHTPGYVFPFCSAWGYWGNQFTPNTLDPTKESVYQFLDDVFTELASLFPGEYIHFGGDEVMHRFWEKEEHIQAFMKEKGMSKVGELQNYFVGRVSQIIASKGKKPIGWNDILEHHESLTKQTAIMSWLGANAIEKASANGFYTVASPASHLYFDITQADRNDGTMCDLAYPNINSLERIYHYNPTSNLPTEQHKFVLGVQANMWPAVPQEVKDINVNNFPRLLGVAEIGWCEAEGKDFKEFESRLAEAYPRLDALKVDYYRPGGYITAKWTPADITEEFAPLEYDVTSKMYADGRIIAGYYFTEGTNHLEISKVELLQDGKVISTDEHDGLADTFRGTNKTKSFLYNLEVKKYNQKSEYKVRAQVKGKNGTDSYGNFTFNLSPYQPFTETEAMR